MNKQSNPKLSRAERLAGQLSWLRPLLLAAGLAILLSGFARLGYTLWFRDRVAETGGFAYIMLQGLRFDLVTIGYLFAIPAALTPFLNALPRIARYWAQALAVYLLAVLAGLVFMEAVTPTFVLEYDIRPNYLFVEYLRYPKEVFSMLFVGYKLEILVCAVTVPVLVWAASQGITRQFARVDRNSLLFAPVFSIAALLLCFAAARSTLDHRPVNASTVAFSADTLVNSLPLNSLYSVANAVYEMRHEDSGFPYGEVAAETATDAVRMAMHLPSRSFVSNSITTAHYQVATNGTGRQRNLVIIVEESLGAEFVGALGGLPLTPNLDALAKEGIWLENLYATGTRSARGLEAIVAGFPPTTSQSVLKLGRSQRDFFTIGAFLKEHGFFTSFIYGGEAQFDNMRRFFAGNGFDTVIDKHDYKNPSFLGSWGVADEVVFDFAHDYFESLPSDKPFASVLFTTSNHSPWEFPEDRIDLYEEPKATVNNAVKYADYAIGRFFRKARQSSYWDNTVFLVVADHNSRVYGSDLVPIEQFHVPGLILGGGIEPQTWTRVASQIDLLPTILSLAGVSGVHPAPGIDLTRADIDSIPGRAVMQYGDTQAYRQDDKVVILRKGKTAAAFDYLEHRLVEADTDQAILEHARALAAWPAIAYRDQLYRLPPKGAEAAGIIAVLQAEPVAGTL